MKVVVPGELISKRPVRMPLTYTTPDGTHAAVIGAYDEKTERFIPLKGPYTPIIGDAVVGVVDEEKVIGYGVDLFSPYRGLLFSRGLRMNFVPGDVITADISEVSEVKDIILGRPRKMVGGQVIFVSPAKVNRVVGKQMSMLNILKTGTQCDIVVGKNGAVWIKGVRVQKAIDAIMKIEEEAHMHGLTDRIQKFLSQ